MISTRRRGNGTRSRALSHVSWSILLICLFEVVFWAAPMLSVPTNTNVPSSERLRLDTEAYYLATKDNFGAADAFGAPNTQRQLLETQQRQAREYARSYELEKHYEKQHEQEQQQTSGGRGNAVPLLTSAALTCGVILFQYAGGQGRRTVAAASSSSGGGAASDKAAKSARSDLKPQQQQQQHQQQVSKSSASLSRGAVAGAAAAAVGVTAVMAIGRRPSSVAYRSVSGALRSQHARLYASSARKAPMANAAARVSSNEAAKTTTATRGVPFLARNDAVNGAPSVLRAEVIGEAAITKQQLSVAPAAQEPRPLDELTNEELVQMVASGELAAHSLEKTLGDQARAVTVRRMVIAAQMGAQKAAALDALPHEHYDYKNVTGQCCENVLGYVPIPVGVVGPMLIDNKWVHLPMATTEGCLVASTHRGAKAISECGGAQTIVVRDGMSRAPVVRMPSVQRAGDLMLWLQRDENVKLLSDAFATTTRFGRVQKISPSIAGRQVYIRFVCKTGDAMGMNMISKGCEEALRVLQEEFPDMQIMSLSGNLCTDKKPSAINWLEGRGKSVSVEATISADVVRRVLKTTVRDLVDLNLSKNLIGSALAGSIGGFNAHASNIVTAIYLATGQDPAQNVESSTCMTLMEETDDGDLHISVTMPSVEVGTVGGGTHLPGQAACLAMMGVRGANMEDPGANARQLASCVASAVLAGELSLMSALAAGHLVRSHMQHNRKK